MACPVSLFLGLKFRDPPTLSSSVKFVATTRIVSEASFVQGENRAARISNPRRRNINPTSEMFVEAPGFKLRENMMKSSRFSKVLQWWLRSVSIVSLTLCAHSTWAALGRDAGSVEQDQVHMKAALRLAHIEPAYLVHELKTPTGTVVREYVSSAGKVFGVAWQGPWLPDFRQILGDYFEPVMQAPRDRRQGRGPLVVRQPHVVFQSAGHMRSFFGRAYVPDLLPKGVSADVVQ